MFHTSAMEDAVRNGGELPTIDISDVIGRAFITTQDSEGEQVQARIDSAKFLQDRTADEAGPLIRFKCRIGDKRFKGIMTYNRMLQWCNQHKDADGFFIINSLIWSPSKS